jgi:hypothetical protein
VKRRITTIALVAVASLVSFGAGVAVTLQVISSAVWHRVEARRAYWTSAVNHEVWLGEPKAEVDAWIARRTHSADSYSADERKFVVTTDVIDDAIGFPCTEWMVMIDVNLGKDDRVVSRSVNTPGECL